MLRSIETWSDGEIALCRVDFTCGAFGFGQVGNKDVDITLELLHRRVAPALLLQPNGKGLSLTWNMEQMLVRKDNLFSPLMELVLSFELNYKMMGVQLSKAVAGVDAAIWDAVARAKGRQVWELWRETFFPASPTTKTSSRAVNVYASSIAREIAPHELANRFSRLKQLHGITAFKMKIGKRMGGITFNDNGTAPPTRNDYIREVDLVHQAIGRECKLAVDANGGFARQALPLLPPTCWFLEEPVPWFHHNQRLLVPNIRIAGGEQEFRADVWRAWIANKTFDIYQPDFGYSGGPSAVLLIALQCQRSGGVSCAPHSPQNDLHPIMALHLLQAMQTDKDDVFMELACVDDGLIQVRLDEESGAFSPAFACAGMGFRVDQGRAQLLATHLPGWGVEVYPNWLQKCARRVSTPASVVSGKNKRSFL